MVLKRIPRPSGRQGGDHAPVGTLVTRGASPPSGTLMTSVCDAESSSRRAENAILRPSGLQSTPPSPPLVFVSLLGAVDPSVGTIQRSLMVFDSSYDGSVTEKTVHLPSGLTTGAPTRFMRKTSSWVMVWLDE